MATAQQLYERTPSRLLGSSLNREAITNLGRLTPVEGWSQLDLQNAVVSSCEVPSVEMGAPFFALTLIAPGKDESAILYANLTMDYFTQAPLNVAVKIS